jgi:ABC-type lipoprotein release transport system permease subunit
MVRNQLFGVRPAEPLVLGSAAVLMAAVAAMAAIVPAWRAARVDPVQALRHE